MSRFALNAWPSSWTVVSGTHAPSTPRSRRRTPTSGATSSARNRRRDIETDDRLKRVGWLAVRVWEHEEPCAAADTIEAVLHQRRLTTAVVRARIG